MIKTNYDISSIHNTLLLLLLYIIALFIVLFDSRYFLQILCTIFYKMSFKREMQIIYSFLEQERVLLKRLSTPHTIYYLIVSQSELTNKENRKKNYIYLKFFKIM